jgi:hypothetical protein
LPELDRELRALAAFVDFPVERDLAPGVRGRLAPRPRRMIPWRRLAVAAAIVLVAGLATAMAVPDARTAILRFIGLESVTVIHVDELPPAASGPAAYGESVSLAEAERVTGFRPLLPDIRKPDSVNVNSYSPELVILLWGHPGTRLRLSELRSMGPQTIEKYVLAEQRTERVEVDGHPGIWVEGTHVVSELFGQPRLAGNALLWQQDGLLLRLEGRLSRDQALRIARSVA